MASDHLYLFTALVAFSRTIQARIKAAASAREIIAIAAENGFAINLDQLRLLAARQTEDHWTWSGQSDQWRERFFVDAGQAASGG